jgi:hypothetical protein
VPRFPSKSGLMNKHIVKTCFILVWFGLVFGGGFVFGCFNGENLWVL